ncbi:uncharacterized protein LOC143545875 [Bidens hawaiensis]|uniref:uncharacterized protein LOC143545875 n=1 Tax=Bidens hawaiensis TaxID=980011 RepID=UPI00404A2E0B
MVWCGDVVEKFSVRSFKRLLNVSSLVIPEHVFVWNKWVPLKVGFIAWRAVLNRLPTFVELAKKNVSVGSLLCPVCEAEVESVDHLFISCGLAQTVWSFISQWCKVPLIYAFSVRDLVELYKYSSFPKDKAKVFHAVCLVSVWCIWKKRNALVHNGTPVRVTDLVEEIKAMSFLWIKNRSKKSGLLWEDWCKFRI